MYLSIVIPVLNEEKNIFHLYSKLKIVLNKLKKPYEIIFVDDGSIDNTYSNVKELSKKDKNVKLISFKKNFGKSEALLAGFDNAKGKFIITMDGDLQDSPEEIPKFIKKIEEGYDLVVGWRHKREDKFTKKLVSGFFNKLTSLLTGIKLHDFNCCFKIFRRECVEDLNLYGELHRYIPVLLSWNGYKTCEIKIRHYARKYGKTKFNIFRLFKGLSDLITILFIEKYGNRPGHIFISIGTLSVFIGFLILSGLIIHQKIYGVPTIVRPLLYISVIMVLGGIQFVTFGILSEMITRIRHEIKGKFYRIGKKLNI